MSSRGMSKKRMRSAPASPARRSVMSAAPDAFTLGDAERREREHGLRLVPGRQGVGHVASHDERQLVLRVGLMQPLEGIDRVGATRERRPPRGRPRSADRPRRRSGRAPRGAPRRVGLDLLVRRRKTGMKQHAVEPELRARLLRADQMRRGAEG